MGPSHKVEHPKHTGFTMIQSSPPMLDYSPAIENLEKEDPITYALVIPAYNEAVTIREVAQRALCHINEILIVDDGSTKETSEVLKGLRGNGAEE